MYDISPPAFNVKYQEVPNVLCRIITLTSYPFGSWFPKQRSEVRDALNVNKTRDNGWWGDHKMTFNLGIPKGLQVVLEERGVNTRKMSVERMREIHDIITILYMKNPASSGFSAKRKGILFTCYRNAIVRLIHSVWAQAKRYSRAHCRQSCQLITYNHYSCT